MSKSVTTFELHWTSRKGVEEVYVVPFADGKPIEHPLKTQLFDDPDKAFKAAKKEWPKATWTNW